MQSRSGAQESLASSRHPAPIELLHALATTRGLTPLFSSRRLVSSDRSLRSLLNHRVIARCSTTCGCGSGLV